MNFHQPDNDEIEISLFGAGNGYGECVLIHYGNGKWIMIDCSLNPKTRKPIIDEYLTKINLQYSSIVKIVATHWHDDHIKGLACVYEKSPNAKFYCSDACSSDEFFQLYSSYKNVNLPNNGIAEISKIIEAINSRDDYHRTLKVDQLLLNETISGSNFEIYALSPSEYSCLMAKKELSKLFPMVDESLNGARKIKPNENCIVLLLLFEDEHILLAADIENTSNDNTGWDGILNLSNILKDTEINVYKVAHHGSEGAYNANVWEKHIKNPISILTPYARGRKKLPTKAAISQIVKDSSKSFITSNHNEPKYKKRQSSTTKAIHNFKKDIYEHAFDYGHIRLRKRIKSKEDWNIELDGASNQLICSDVIHNSAK